MGLSIAPPPVQEEWRPSLQQVAMSGGESRLAALHPSLLGVAPSPSVMSTAAVAAVVMAAIPMVTAEVRSEVTLTVPPPTVAEEERRETRLPISPSGGAHGSPAWSELEGFG